MSRAPSIDPHLPSMPSLPIPAEPPSTDAAALPASGAPVRPAEVDRSVESGRSHASSRSDASVRSDESARSDESDASGGRFARWRWLRVYFGAWGAIAGVYFFLGLFNGKDTVLEDAAYVLVSWGCRALAMLPAVWVARRFPLEGPRWPRNLLLAHLPAAPLLAAAKGAGVVLIAGRWTLIGPIDWGYVQGDMAFNLVSYAGVVGAVHGVGYYRRFLEREREAAALQLRASRLEARLARAQLDALKAQLQPHFLFNTLHSISALIHEDAEAADQMVERLGRFLRMVLDDAGAQEVPLRRELEFLDEYLQIQRTRYRQRLHFTVDAEPGALDARVPNLLLQPLVENAIRHAVEPRAAGGRVEVGARREGHALRLWVRDDGPGLSRDPWAGGTGVGLANTRERLRQLHGAEHAFELRNREGGGVEALIVIPFREHSDGDEADAGPEA
jgi:two-component system, LytTR family, sensor kinase